MATKVVACAGRLAILVVVMGCGGPKTVPATGKVVLPDGSPLPGGQVEFRSTDPSVPMAMAVIGTDGQFRLATSGHSDGVIPGDYRAIVIQAIPDESSSKTAAASVRIDPKFMDYKTSGLKFSVSEDPEKNDFQIQVRRASGN
jgi:hypothetical protein